MEYSLQSKCLVTVHECGEVHEAPDAYDTTISVLDLAADGRMLCRLNDNRCALCNSNTCLAGELQ